MEKINQNKLKLIRNYLDFLWAMTEKEIKARYKRAVFGFLWVILNPLFQMIIIGVIFKFLIDIPNYFLFLFSGLLPWQFFSLSLSKATPSFVYERFLLQKAKFPKEAIPISIVLANFFNLIIAFVVLSAFLLVTGNLDIQQLLILVPAMLWLLTLTTGISLLTSSLNVRFRDINFFVQSILILVFYATPILYNLSLIPRKHRILFSMNPLTTIFELIHLAVVNQGHRELSASILLANVVVTLMIVTIGILVYKKQHQFFVDWL